jgi:hypothetical protein
MRPSCGWVLDMPPLLLGIFDGKLLKPLSRTVQFRWLIQYVSASIKTMID